jgi:restriction endonuclease
MSTSSASQLTCFIAAEHSLERSLLRRQLEERQITCFSLDRVATVSGPTGSVYALIRRSDFVVGVLSSNANPNVVFELGVALGLKKPLLLFGDRSSSSIPSDLAGINILRLDKLVPEAWSGYIDAFLQTVRPGKGVSTKSPGQKGGEPARRWREIRGELDRLVETRGAGSAAEFERLIERAFVRGGFPASSSPGKDFGADFAVASPKLVEAFGLPILIEVKFNVERGLPRDTVDRLAALIRERRGGAGLVVTAEPVRADINPDLAVPVAVVAARELFDWLQAAHFEERFVPLVNGFWTTER